MFNLCHKTNFYKFWFYLISPKKRRKEIEHGGSHWPIGVGCSPFVIYNKKVYLLSVYDSNINKAQKKLRKAMKSLSQLNNTEFEIVPVPEDWFVGNNIVYSMRIKRKLINLINLASLQKINLLGLNVYLDVKKLKTEVNNKIVLNKKWTKRFEKLLSLVESYERNPRDMKLLEEIVVKANCLDIFIKDKIIIQSRK